MYLEKSLDMDSEWPKVIAEPDAKVSYGFGFSPSGCRFIVPCDFDSLAQQSLVVGKMMAEGNDRPKVLERCCGDEIYPRPLAYQLVAFYLSAKTRGDTPMHFFVSREEFEVPCKGDTKTFLALSAPEHMFLGIVRQRGFVRVE